MSLEQVLEKWANELSLLLIMVDASDRTGIEALVSLCSQIKKEVANLNTYARVVRAVEHIELLFEDPKKGSEVLLRVDKFVSALNTFFSDPDKARFPNEDDSATNGDFEFSPNFDQDFLAEYIEKHLSMLDDLEAQVLECRFNAASQAPDYIEKFNKYTRSYLHNIKGDSGAIGIAGIEQVTHVFEDLLLQRKPAEALSCLLMYKEYAQKCLRNYADNIPPPEHSSSFIERLRTSMLSPLSDDLVSKPGVEAPLASQHSSENAPLEQEKEPSSEPATQVEVADLSRVGEEYTISADNALFAEFAAEAEDHLNEVERVMLEEGEAEAISDDGVDKAFRGVHSLKGASSFFNIVEINETSHVLETVLDGVRKKQRPFDAPLIQLVLEYIDLQKKLLSRSRSTIDNGGVVKRCAESETFLFKIRAYDLNPHLSHTSSGNSVAEPPTQESAPSAPPPPSSYQTTEVAKPEIVPDTSQTKVAATNLQKVDSTPAAKESSPPSSKEPTPDEKKSPTAASKTSPQKPSEAIELKTFVKIDTARLDHLIESIGEMVIYSSMLIRKCRDLLGENEAIAQTAHQVEKFSRDLQEIGMAMRLDPIKGLFQKMSRLVWDVSKKIGKDVAFVMKGEDTELDRNVIEKLADPLMHMVRNAIDHGIESPEQRIAAGKPGRGTVELQAFHAGGSINILIKDDGRGLNKQRIRAKAIEKGIISPDQTLTDSETYNLIFAPGFSTAEQVTDISGRGVGMDVVRNNIESMRGHVFIESVEGQGSVFVIELPLTLAIIDGIETLVGPERFIIPTLSVMELIKPTKEMLFSSVGENDTFHFRDKSLPLYTLAKLYGIEGSYVNHLNCIVVVLDNAGEQVALLVDNIVGNCQTVIKSLGSMFKEGRGLAGCAIMSNGDIGLILDVRSLLQLAKGNYRFDAKIDTAKLRDEIFGLAVADESKHRTVSQSNAV